MAAGELSWEQAIAWRMGAHGLLERAPRERMLDVTARICGLHAQVMSSAELTLWARVEGLEPDDVATALWDERALVKTWAMRGTLHLLPTADYGLWQAALSTYDHYLKPHWLRAFGLTAEGLEELLVAVGDALDGATLTREELAAAVVGATGAPELGEKLRESWGAFLKPASFRGGLCFGPSEGRYVRFTSPQGWVGDWEKRDPQEALLEVACRYLGAHGPATREDLARWWGGASPAQAQRLFEALGDRAIEVDLEGTRAWLPAEALTEAQGAPPPRSLRLLPGFDHWVIAASRRPGAMVDEAERKRVYRPQGWISPVMLLGGRIEGVWRHERKGRRLEVTLEPFQKLPGWARSAAEEEAERLALFLGGELAVSWT